MRVQILKGVCLGSHDAYPGQTHNVIDSLGRHLISRGAAKAITEAEAAKPEIEAITVVEKTYTKKGKK